MQDDTKFLVDFSGDSEPDISVSSWSDAQISEIIQQQPESGQRKQKNLASLSYKSKIHPKSQWYQNYVVSEKYEARHDEPPQAFPCGGTDHHQNCGLDCKWISESQGEHSPEKEIGEE